MRLRFWKRGSATRPRIAGCPDLEGFVVIVTYGRSGSTLLQSVLGSIDGYWIKGENMNALNGLFMSWKSIRETARAHGHARGRGHPWDGAGELKPGSYRQRLARSFVEEVLRPPPQARIAGFKEIRWFGAASDPLELLEFTRKSFAPVRFILNSRQVEGLAGSSWWARLDRSKLVRHIAAADAAMDAFAARHPDICHRIRYEDYAGRPDGLRGLFEFLGEPFDASRVETVLGRRLDHARKGRGRAQKVRAASTMRDSAV